MHPMGRQALFKRYSQADSTGMARMCLRISVKPRQDMPMLRDLLRDFPHENNVVAVHFLGLEFSSPIPKNHETQYWEQGA